MMTKQKEDLLCWDSVKDRGRLIELLRNDCVVISSTDTIHGFLGVLSERVYDEIIRLKQVTKKRPFLILVGSIDKMSHFVASTQLSNQMKRFVSSCWPGPVTFIFKSRQDLPPFLSSEKGTIAIRCPDHKGLLAILSQVDGLFSTSANKSGEQPPRALDEIDSQLLEEVSAVVTDCATSSDSGDGDECRASTIIDLSRGDMRVVREGTFQIEKLKEFYDRSK